MSTATPLNPQPDTQHRIPPLLAGCRAERMRRRLPITLMLAAVLDGCAASPPASSNRVEIKDDVQRIADRDFVSEPFSDQARAAVIRQSTIFEWQFVTASARLTPLGRRDIGILAEALRESSGTISVRRGSAAASLYSARMAEVRRLLVAAGIDPARVEIGDQFPGGAGTTTEDALLIRSEVRATPMKPISDAVLTPPQSETPQPGAQP